MIKPKKPASEQARLEVLKRYEILDTLPERAYDDLLTIAVGICGTPMGSVSFVDADRQFFKARRGMPVPETPRDVAFCAHAIMTPDQMLIVPDARDDLRFHDNPLVTGTPGIRFYAGAPLVSSEGEATGTLCVMDSQPRKLDAFQQEAMMVLSRQVTTLLELRVAYKKLQHHLSEREWYEDQLKSYQGALEEQNADLIEQTRIDPLTGLSNRRALNLSLDAAIQLATKQGSSLAMAIIDIDHFKTINDLHGHPVGDETLASVARVIHAQRGQHGFTARCGGEEFALLMSQTDAKNAELQCDYIREAVQNLPQGLPVTVSIGVTLLKAGDSAASLYARADEAMYVAKKGGRNRVVFG